MGDFTSSKGPVFDQSSMAEQGSQDGNERRTLA